MSDAGLAGLQPAFDVFISYAHADKVTADAVCAHLENEGIRCWIAPRDITPGVDWSAAIVEALGRCRLFALVFSSNANESAQIRNEIVQAVNNGLPIVPFRIEETAPTKSLAYFMGGVHWLDALTPPLEAHIATLAATVRTLLEADVNKQRARASAARPPSRDANIASNRLMLSAPLAALILALALIAASAAYWFAGGHAAVNNSRAILVFNPPTDQDIERIRDAASQHAMILPDITYRAPAGELDPEALRFVGVWSSEIGYNGVGRQVMLIVTTLGADRTAEGYVLNGKPTEYSLDQNIGPNTQPFHGRIENGALTFVPLGGKAKFIGKLGPNAENMTLGFTRPDGKQASALLKPIWRLVNGS